ncbi:hypothetical protein DL93DRAFT_1684009 [Clavulina sp. PMI_390]|nr:hypothetical protein DL93DRAFT_1684009 [Clavulina sp. PMI_390]
MYITIPTSWMPSRHIPTSHHIDAQSNPHHLSLRLFFIFRSLAKEVSSEHVRHLTLSCVVTVHSEPKVELQQNATTTITMGVWSDLPAEIATEVLNHLAASRAGAPASQAHLRVRRKRVEQGLLSCSYVSHQFHTIIEPYLYCNIWLDGGLRLSPEGVIFQSWNNLYQLTRAIVQRPELGIHVRNLSVATSGFDYKNIRSAVALQNSMYGETDVEKIVETLSHTESGREDLRTILSALPSVGLRNGIIVHGGINGVIIVLLHLLLRLRGVEFRATYELEYIAYSCFGTLACGIPAGLKSISKLSLSCSDIDGGFLTNGVVPFMTLPRLQTLKVYAFHGEDNEDGDEDDGLKLRVGVKPSPGTASTDNDPTPLAFIKMDHGYSIPQNSSSITDLRFISCDADGSLISKILTIPTHLERFGYVVGGQDNGSGAYTSASLLPGLLSQSASLKDLAINSDAWDPLEDQPFIGVLADMTALQEIRISARVLFEIDETNMTEPPNNLAPRDTTNWISRRPPNLITLKLDLESIEPSKFLVQTGLPGSLVNARRRIPTLCNILITGDEHLQPPDEQLFNILAHVPILQPAMNFSLYGITHESGGL